jgi:hypothetical protein
MSLHERDWSLLQEAGMAPFETAAIPLHANPFIVRLPHHTRPQGVATFQGEVVLLAVRPLSCAIIMLDTAHCYTGLCLL